MRGKKNDSGGGGGGDDDDDVLYKPTVYFLFVSIG